MEHLLDRKNRPIRPGSRVTAFGQLGEEDRDVPIYEGIAVRSASGLELVIEKCHVKQHDPPWKIPMGGNYVFELVKK